ncbi:MAG: diacylglycerol kinase family protein [Pirellulaceae bacterium]|nr:hypothetical protein [Planctomycetales bacterium]
MEKSDGGDRDRVLILDNPRAGTGERRRRLEDLVGELGARRMRVERISDVRDLRQRVEAAQRMGDLRVVVAAGGDGTAQLLANETPAGVALTVYPMGTENLLSKYLGMSTEAKQFAEMISRGRTVTLDAGEASGRIFLLMAGIGFDAAVVEAVHRARRGNISHWNYAFPILKTMWQYRYPRMRVQWEREGEGGAIDSGEAETEWAFIFNLPVYAAGLRIPGEADGRDGQLDIRTFRGRTLARGLFHLATIGCGCQGKWSGSDGFRASTYRIELADGGEGSRRVPYQLDGDPAGELPVEIRVIPKRLRLMVPAGVGDDDLCLMPATV